jgi:hypothetical protein
MRVSALTAGILLTTAIVSVFSIQPAMAHQARVTCLCDCPDDHKVKTQAAVRPVAPPPRRVVRRAVRRYAGGGTYRYGMAAPVIQHAWREEWRQAPNDAFIPGPAPMPMAYGPPPPPPVIEGMRIDDRGWTGGVGTGGGGGGGGGGDGGGYGQVHFGTGGSIENGPTYNSYNQSFQSNPSQPGPFQNRLMGGFAPPATK